MSGIDTGLIERQRRDRLSQWVFWSLWSIIVLIAAAFYYEKANDHKSAFVRWRPQVLQFWDGVNIYDKMLFPTPPLMPITLYPLMVLPTIVGAMLWFAIKVGLTTASLAMCFRLVQREDGLYPPLFRSLVLLLSLRPILGDLHHGNNNLLILFLIVAMLTAWRQGYDIGAGLLLALATTYKVTPALFFVYFAYKRSWRTVMWGVLGMGIFLLIVPSAIIGPDLQRGMPRHVVAPHGDALRREGRREPGVHQPVDRRRDLPAAHRAGRTCRGRMTLDPT